MDTNKTPTKRPVRDTYSSAKLHARREKRRIEAEERQAKHDALSNQDKMLKALKRGGSKKERKKLSKLLAA